MTEKRQNIKNITQISLTGKMIKILDFLKTTGEEFNAKTLAIRLRLNLNTTRAYLNRLTKAKRITCKTLDRTNFYSIPIKIPEVKPELPELKFHGLTLKFHHQGKTWIGFPGWWRKPIYLISPQTGEISTKPHRVSNGGRARKLGVVKFQQGKENLMVYYDASKRPLNWEEFLGFLKEVGRLTRCDLLTDPRWEIRQGGLGNDFCKHVLEGFQGSISIHDFVGHVARIYNKTLADGTEVIRTELHGDWDMTIGGFLESLQGGMLFGNVMNLVGRQTIAQEQTSTLQGILIKKIDHLVGLLMQFLERRNGG